VCKPLDLPSDRKTDVHGAPQMNPRTEKYDTLFCELSPAKHSFLLLTDNF